MSAGEFQPLAEQIDMTQRLAFEMATRCGHNFAPKECPYAECGYRSALERIQELTYRLQVWNDTAEERQAERDRKLGEALERICVCSRCKGTGVVDKHDGGRVYETDSDNEIAAHWYKARELYT